jgi:hypothetical protein
MRTRRSLTTALALALTLTAMTASAATRDAAPARPERPSIVAKVKRVLLGIIRSFEKPTVPIPGAADNE